MSDPFGPYALPGYTNPSPLFQPGGYLTLVSGTPVITSDQASKTIVYYAQDVHDAFPIIKNGQRCAIYFDAPRLVLSSAHAASGIYDVFGVERNGQGHIVTGPVWSTVTAGSCARGTGGATTELTRKAGLLVNRWGIPGLNDDGSQYIEPLQGTYLGSIFIDGSAGQVTCHRSYGQNRKWGVWNAYNRRPIHLKVGDATVSWTYGSATVRPTNNSTDNKGTPFSGLAEELVRVQRYQYGATPASCAIQAGIGWNSTTVSSGLSAQSSNDSTAGVNAFSVAHYDNPTPPLGINNVTSLENANASGSTTILGAEASCLMTILWRG